MIGYFAFWTDKSSAFNYTLGRFIFFLSGGLIPIAFFPTQLQTIMTYLPFKYMFSLPIQIISKGIPIELFLKSILIEIVWIVILWWLNSKFFSISIKNNESVGI
jgi:ABC-2 type transport system permease protein